MKIDTPHVVFSDLHGRVDLLEACTDRYGAEVTYVSGGDAIGAPKFGDNKATIGFLLDIEAELVEGNYERVTGAAISTSGEIQKVWAAGVWLPGCERGILSEYGVKRPKTGEVNGDSAAKVAKKLRKKMESIGHLAFFDRMKPYYETADFLVVHGGLVPEVPYQEQLNYLDSVSGNLEGFSSHPVQIYDPEHTLSSDKKMPRGVDLSGRALITGHRHTREKERARATEKGKRVRLAGPKEKASDPLYVWQSWDGKVVPIVPNRKK